MLREQRKRIDLAVDGDRQVVGVKCGAVLSLFHFGGQTLADPIVDQVSREASLTYDRARRKALYQQEESRIHELVPAVFFYWQNSYSAVNSDLRNWKPASYISDFWNCWEWTM